MQTLIPAFSSNNIPIVFSSDNNYSPYLGVCIKSLLEHTSINYNYDICILDGGILEHNKNLLKNMQKANISIRFIDIQPYIGAYDVTLFTLRIHFTIATYYRFFLPQIFENYQKVVYLDCDMLVLRDVAELFSIDVGDNYLGATRDLDILVSLRKRAEIRDYLQNILKLQDNTNYFQAGCMVANLNKMRSDNFTETCIQKLREIKIPRYVDQCIMNSVCENKIWYIPQNWNYTWHISKNVPNYMECIPSPYAKQYYAALNDPYIIHFTSVDKKPWYDPSLEEAYLFWKYARMTPFAEVIMYNNIKLIKSSSEILNYRSIYRKYLKYKLLSMITFGKARKKYKAKYSKYRNLSKCIKEKINEA